MIQPLKLIKVSSKLSLTGPTQSQNSLGPEISLGRRFETLVRRAGFGNFKNEKRLYVLGATKVFVTDRA